MLTRRIFCGCLAAGAGFAATSAHAQGAECAVFTPDRQRATTPDEALERLTAGNARFVSGRTVNCDPTAQVKATATGQAPFAAVVGCIDSRAAPELVFDQRIGDIFAARIAGNFINADILGSLEFATKVAGAKLVMVLGHSECGAVKGAIDNVRLGNLTAMLAHIRPAVAATRGVAGERNSKNAELVQKVADRNVTLALAALTKQSRILRELVAAKQLRIVGAMHDVATGRVEILA